LAPALPFVAVFVLFFAVFFMAFFARDGFAK